VIRWLQGCLVLPDRLVDRGLVRIDDGRIVGVWDLSEGGAPRPDPRETLTVDAGYVAPGFVDLHVHGGGGADFMDADPEAVATVTATHARYGTTALLATTLTAPEEAILAAIRAVRAAPRVGARVVGFHVEGPFISPRMKGAQDDRHIRAASLEEIDRWFAAAGPGWAWQVTLAPEVPGALEAIRHLADRGAVASAGHTDCTYARMRAAAEAGLRHVTHLFNAMRGIHHREPGAAGAALTLPGLTAEVVADGVHVHPAVLGMAVRMRGVESVVLVTDAMRAAAMPDGVYRLGGLTARVQDGVARLPDGSLAGSALTMDAAVRNMVRLVGVSLPEAVAMASRNPARVHGLDHRKGAVAPGRDADLVVLDRDLRVVLTMVGGRIAFDGR
jgi:N-acetylglucosamine-6-phosphate deacetylase